MSRRNRTFFCIILVMSIIYMTLTTEVGNETVERSSRNAGDACDNTHPRRPGGDHVSARRAAPARMVRWLWLPGDTRVDGRRGLPGPAGGTRDRNGVHCAPVVDFRN